MAIGFSMGGALTMAALEAGAPADAAVLIAPFTRFGDRRALLLPLLRRVVATCAPTSAPTSTTHRCGASSPRSSATSTSTTPPRATASGTRCASPPRRSTSCAAPAVTPGASRRASPRAPTLVVQGLHDTTVTPETTVALLRRLRGAPLRLMLDGADHRVLSPGAPGHDELLRALQRFGHEQLGRLG
jgi:alpha-beta hydrolase superfamily lysophospholipase